MGEEGGVELPAGAMGGAVGEMSGYLSKKTRDGRWQRRFFETHGYYLTYYKSKKKQKILAALGLPQVGEIKQVPKERDPDGEEGLFELELNTRIYTLRAKSNEEAAQWVKVLIKLREQGQRDASNSAENKNKLPLSEQDGAKLTKNMENSKPEGDWEKTSSSCCCSRK